MASDIPWQDCTQLQQDRRPEKRNQRVSPCMFPAHVPSASARAPERQSPAEMKHAHYDGLEAKLLYVSKIDVSIVQLDKEGYLGLQ